jgi:hypothetical protein
VVYLTKIVKFTRRILLGPSIFLLPKKPVFPFS